MGKRNLFRIILGKIAAGVCCPALMMLTVCCHNNETKNIFNMSYLNQNIDTIQTPQGAPLYVTFLRHASLILTFDGKVFYVDPLKEYMTSGDYPKADYILITHDHYDHCDKEAVEALCKKGTEVITNADAARQLGRGHVMKNGDRLELSDGVSVEAVPAYNTTPGHTQFHPRGRDNGYVLTLGGLRVYISGDTEVIPELSLLKDIDVAFLPVNQPYTMTLEQADEAARIIKPKRLYPYHFGDTPVARLKKMLDGTGIEVVVHEMP